MRLGLLLAMLACRGPEWKAASTAPTGLADVVGLRVDGDAGTYRFWVTVRSPDESCQRWAPFWEVVDAQGQSLLFRRGFAHSHAGEQPFTRSGAPVAVDPDDELVVRAFMSPGGYGGQALAGSIRGGFQPVVLPEGFGDALLAEGQRPEVCAF